MGGIGLDELAHGAAETGRIIFSHRRPISRSMSSARSSWLTLLGTGIMGHLALAEGDRHALDDGLERNVIGDGFDRPVGRLSDLDRIAA